MSSEPQTVAIATDDERRRPGVAGAAVEIEVRPDGPPQNNAMLSTPERLASAPAEAMGPFRVGSANFPAHYALTTRKSDYLRRLDARRALHDLKRQVVFGLVVGWLLTIISFIRYQYVPFVNETLWATLTVVGLLIVATAVIAPGLLALPERGLMFVTRGIGKMIFVSLLTIIFFVLITPMGAIMRATRGLAPFYAWEGPAPIGMDGWVKKVIPGEALGAGTARAGSVIRRRNRGLLIVQPARVVGFFIRQGHYLFIPTLVIIIMLGLIMFFVKSSALAPFIYTLF